MRYFESLDRDEQELLARKVAAFEATIEGQPEAAAECLEEIRALERARLAATVAPSA